MILILQLIAGTLLGFLVGLIPSVHINTIAFIFAVIGVFNYFPDSFYFFFAVALSQLVSSFVPACLFGTPNESNLMSVFPAQRLFLQGKAKLAIILCMNGLLFGAVFSLILMPVLYLLFSVIFTEGWFIAIVIFLMLFVFVFSENGIKNKLIVILIITLSGLLGIFTLKQVYFLKNPLVVCIPCLFAIPTLLLSFFESPAIIKQQQEVSDIPAKKSILFSISGAIASMFAILIPTFSSSQAALIISKIKKRISTEEYLLVFSSIAICTLIFSFCLAIYFSKARLGYISAIMSSGFLPVHIDFLVAGISVLFVTSLSIFFVISLLDGVVNFVNKVSLRLINFIIIFIFLITAILLSGSCSIPFIILSTAIGFLPVLFSKSRVILMAYLMVPTLLFYI